MRQRRVPIVISTTIAALTLAACTDAPEPETKQRGDSASFPVEVSSCGFTSELSAAPQKAITLNQGATEIMLALDLADHLAGTAYLDDAVAQRWEKDYDTVPVLSKEYPTNEQLIAAEPDFVYASYSSAFENDVAGPRDQLAETGVSSYLSPFGCEDKEQRPEPSYDAVWDEVASVATAFGVPERADKIRKDQQATLDRLAQDAAGKDLTVVWWDGGTKAPTVGAGDGGPALVMDAVGATNAFADAEGSWIDSSWEDVVKADPDVIVLVDASWDTAADKRKHLESDPALSKL
ncbi:MAG: ABC transporter substrate-binding protein, partial [Nocardioidaceae bacterium]|nr:ABC transporter substrate-binding protein [Nocardioidaceae bacterium]